jgi:predicted nucleic acid-binding protein
LKPMKDARNIFDTNILLYLLSENNEKGAASIL